MCRETVLCVCPVTFALLSFRDASTEERYEITKERQKMLKEQREAHSLWMDKLYKLSLANHVSCGTLSIMCQALYFL